MYEILVNPGAHSGKGIQLWKSIEPVFKSKNVDYHINYTNYFNENDNVIPDLYKEYKARGEELHLIVMGGDGTVNGTLQKIPSFDNIKLSVIPLGSGNDLIRDLDFKGSLNDITCHLLDNPEEHYMDIGNIHCENTFDGEDPVDRRFIVSTGFGYDASICEEVMRSSAKTVLNRLGLGKLVYLIVALKQLAGAKYIEGIMKIGDNHIPLKRFLFVAAMNHRYEGGGFMFGPEAKDNDGILEICAVSGLSKPKTLQVLPTAFKGGHFKFDGVDHYRTGDFEVESDVPLWVHTDGEVITQANKIKVSVDKQILKFVY